MRKISLAVVMSIGLLITNYRSQSQVITTIAGTGVSGYSGDGSAATLAELQKPAGMAIDDSGYIYIADRSNQRIRKISPSGIISTIAGTGTAGFSGDGSAATGAQLNNPDGVAIDTAGNIYIADESNNRIRVISPSGIINTLAGNGTAGFSGDGAAAISAELHAPHGVAVDMAGNVYVTDYSNNRIRKIDILGNISTVAGTGTAGYSGNDSAATLANLNYPYGITIDATGNIFFADYYNNRIREIDAAGIIHNVAGSGFGSGGGGGFSGDGSAAIAAELFHPTGVAVDAVGNVYIADFSNQRIRKVNTGGTINTFAGNGTYGYTGDGVAPTTTEVFDPSGVAIDNNGNLYIGDTYNNRVRFINNTNRPPVFIYGNTQSAVACENSVKDISSYLKINDSDFLQTETWSASVAPIHGSLSVSYTATSADDTLTPAGLTYTPTTGFTGADSFTILITDGLDTAYTTLHVTVNALPVAGVITGDATICADSVVTLFDTASGGTWSSATTGVATVSTTGVVTGITSGVATISYSLSNSCGTTAATKTITVNPLPSAGIITGVTNACVGTSITLSDTASGGFWGNSDPAVANITSLGIVTAFAAGVDTISYTVSNGCGLQRVHMPFIVNAHPAVISVSDTVCAGNSGVISASGAGSYMWSPASGLSCTDCAAPVVSLLSTAIYTVVGTSAGCTDTTTATFFVNTPVAITASISYLPPVFTLTTTATHYTALWYVNDSLISSTTDTPSWSFTAATGDTDSISVVILPLSGCYTSDSVTSDTVFVYGSLGVSSVAKNSYSIYPNPFTDHIVVNGCHQGDVITITDIIGSLVLSQKCTGANGTQRIALPSALKPGGYLARIRNAKGNQVAVEKILKQ